MLPKPAKPSKHRPQIHSNDLLKFSKLPFASLQRLQPHLPQQAPQGQGHFPNRHPRAKATSRTGTPRPGHSNGFLWAFKAAVCQPANAPKLSKPSKCSQNPPNPPNTVLPTGTPGPRPLPQQAPQGQGHFPNRHPKARPQQWLSMGLQSCRLPARKRSETLQTLQMLPKPAKPSKHRPPNKHPRAKATSPTGTPGRGHSNGFLWAFKAAICQPANAPKLSKRSKCSQNPPNPPNTVRSRPFPNRHPRAKATSRTGTPGPGHSNGFLWAFKAAVCQPAHAPQLSKRSKCSQNPPNPPNSVRSRPFPNRHPRAKATSPTGTPGPGHSNDNGFLWAFKAAVCQPANAPKLSKRSKCSQNPPNPPNTVPRSTAMTCLSFQSCRLPACKGCNPTFPNRHPRAKAKATSRTGTPRPGHSNGFLWAFKAAVCQPANAPKLSKPSKCSQNPPNPPNTVLPTGTPGPRPLPQQAPQGQGHFPNRHPKARPQQWLSMGFQSCRLPARKRSETLQTLQMLPKPAKPSKHRPPNKHPGPRPLPQQAPQGQATAMAFYGLSKLPFASPQTLRNSPNAPNAPKTRQTLQTPSAAGPSPTGTPGPRPLPQQAPQGQATAMAFYGLSKLTFASRQTLRNSSCSKCSQNPPNPPNTVRSRPSRSTAMTFLRLSKLPFASPQTLQNSPNAPNPAKPAKPSKHRPQQAPQIHSNDFLEAFKADVCQPAKAATPPSPTGTPVAQQAPQGQGHFPNRHPKARPQQSEPIDHL